MIENKIQRKEYYQALVNKDAQYDGIFYAGIKTTGIFCHATCRARKPKFENTEFYKTAEEALLAGYRPCKICNPLSYPQDIPYEVKKLVEEVEKHPEKRWKEQDFRELGIHSATARRKFNNLYGMSFVQYARSRRMGIAFKEIQNGEKVIDQQLSLGYESASGFNDAFTKIMGNPPKKTDVKVLYAKLIPTPIGRMICVSDEEYLYLLEFMDRRGLEREIERMRNRLNARILQGETSIASSTEKQLSLYFKKELDEFHIPLYLCGSTFQKSVWNLLTQIPNGTTTTYAAIAKKLHNDKAVRAVGNANGMNQIAIVVPCHRVINSNGELGGYGGGIERKQYLLNLENENRNA